MTEFTSADPLAAAHLIRRNIADFTRRMRGLRAPHGVSASKLSVLGRLQRAGRPLTASELASLERLQPQSLTRIIADLQEAGLIVRSRNDDDRRQFDIALSEAGGELVRRDAIKQSQWLAEAMAAELTVTECAMVTLASELLSRIADHEPSPVRAEAVEDVA